MESPKGYLCLVLHGHLPFVRHPEMPECLEEEWFFEAMTEVYLPLLEIFQRLQGEGVGFKVAFSLSPTLTAMFSDSLLAARYDRYLENGIRLAQEECRRTSGSPEFAPLAKMYRDRFLRIRDLWVDRFDRDLVGAFRGLQEGGQVELLTTAATHGFLPLMEVSPAALRAQVEIGCESFKWVFGSRPAGFWLPECGYTPLVGRVLQEAGIRYSFLETHGILHASPRPKFGLYAPVRTPDGLILFGRDPETARQVWSSIDGYPGDEWYREFYRQIGFGIKYFRITGARTEEKQPYNPAKARERVKEHAGNFLFNRERQVEHLFGLMEQPAVVTAMYDAELFGHWWFEGPEWLEALFREFDSHRSVVQLAAPSEILNRLARIQEVSPHLSTWGWKGYNEVWLQGANAWIYRHLHRAAWRMQELVAEHPTASGLTARALTQALRELLLAQASDWPFMLGQGTTAGYAQARLIRHLTRFTKLYEQIKAQAVDENRLAAIEGQENLFPFLDPTTCLRPEGPICRRQE